MSLFWFFPLICLVFMIGMMFMMFRHGGCMSMRRGAQAGGGGRETPREMKRATFAPYLMLVLAALGVADAFYDSYAVYAGQLLWCPPPIDGCNTVANSPYARVFGVPLGYLGVVFYLLMFALAALLLYDPFSRGLRLGALLYAGVGVSGSIGFMYVLFAVIRAFCIYCAISGVLTVLLLIVAAVHFRATRGSAVPGRPQGDRSGGDFDFARNAV
jgi:uncharacterized membrane protein